MKEIGTEISPTAKNDYIMSQTYDSQLDQYNMNVITDDDQFGEI